MKTIAIDFDGVIHKYSKGWHNGTIYDEPIDGAFHFLVELSKGYTIFIFSSRSPWQIKRWLEYQQDVYYPMTDFSRLWFQVVPFWKMFWNKKGVIGITKRKLPAIAYIDDRAIKFNGNWKEIKKIIEA